MNTERWKKARQIFDAALEKDPGERSGFLQAACGEDRELRQTVERLLADTSDQTDSWLDSGASVGLVRRALERRSFAGQTIGDFVVRGVLGSGGMATVFEAEQQHPVRPVALKIMRFGLLSDVAQRRFEYESQVLAGLRHPGIAQVYSTGTYHDKMSGQELPYFAMEFVEGARTLSQYVEEEACGLGDTLRLFLSVCQAVHYGHQRGFIHRDLKPQNILVDDRGRPKIIDFGIARTTASESGEQTLHTQQGEILGTLHYMSPEQVDPDEKGLDIRCDVYALGVILFELIAGRLPFELEGKPVTAAITTILRTDPPRPSSLGSRFSRTPQAEDLDWVVLKAMDKDRERRYASATELAADLERILADEPILARPPSRLYLTRKFVKRHRISVSAAAIVVVSLIAGITMTAISLEQAKQSAQEAKAALATAELEIGTHQAVNDFLGRMLTSADPYSQGRDVRVIDVLDQASKDAEQLYADRPQWAAAVANQLGGTYSRLGQLDKAGEHLERAVAIARKSLDPTNYVTLTSIHNLGAHYLGLMRLDEAEQLLNESLQGRRQVFGPRSREVAESTMVLGQVAYRREQFDTALARYTEASDIFLEALGPSAQLTVQANAGLGVVLNALGRTTEAEERLRFAVDNGEPQLGPEHPTVLSARESLAQVLSDQGNLPEATEMFQAVLEVQERVMGPDHTSTLTTLNNLASALQRQGRAKEAEERYRDLVTRRRQEGQPDLVMASALNNLGVCLETQDRLQEAEASIQEALELLEQLRIPEQHWIAAAFRKSLAVVRIKQERYAEAETTLKESIAIFEGTPGDQGPRIRKAIEALVTLYEAWDKPELAQEMREKLVAR